MVYWICDYFNGVVIVVVFSLFARLHRSTCLWVPSIVSSRHQNKPTGLTYNGISCMAMRSIGRLCNCKQANKQQSFHALPLICATAPAIYHRLTLPSYAARTNICLKWHWFNNFFSETSLQTLLANNTNSNRSSSSHSHVYSRCTIEMMTKKWITELSCRLAIRCTVID